MSDPTRRADISEVIWEVAHAYDWRISVRHQVALAGWIADQNRLTGPALTAACERLGTEPPRGALSALRHRVMDADRRRLTR